MKPMGLLIAVALLAVLGGLTWWSNKSQADKAKTPTDTTTKLLTIPDDQFQEIKIHKLTGEQLDLKRENGKWRMTAPTALPAALSGAKITLAVAIIAAFIAETTTGATAGPSAGLGWEIVNDITALQTSRAYAAVAILTGFAVLFTMAHATRARWLKEE